MQYQLLEGVNENSMGTHFDDLETRRKIQTKISIFLLLTFVITSISYYFMITTGTARKIGPLWMWSPGIAAILTKLFNREGLKGFGWQPGKLKYLALGLGIPFLYALVIYSVVWATGLGDYSPQPFFRIALFATVGLIMACLVALGEEIGWRGFLIPELVKVTSYTKAVVFTGIVWAVWHYPAMIYADYNAPTTPLAFQLVSFTIMVIGLSSISAWLFLKSKSIWPAVLWHGGHNLFIQQIFKILTVDTGITYYFVDDFGIGILTASVLLGIFFT